MNSHPLPGRGPIAKIESLTFFRFVAAAIVAVFHFGREATGFSGIMVAGPQMVTFFFVLSGFVMGISHLNGNTRAWPYWWSRVARIMPVYLVALLLTVLMFGVNDRYISKRALLLSLMFLQAWLPPHPLALNGPGWSLSVEAFFYLIFPFAVHMIKRRHPSPLDAFAASLGLWLVTQIVLATGLMAQAGANPQPFIHDLINYFPLAHLCSFLLGVCGAFWFIKTRHAIDNELGSLCLVALAALGIVATIDESATISSALGLRLAMGSSFLAPLYLLFVLAVALSRSRSISAFGVAPLALLGDASFSLYILQFPVHEIYVKYISGSLALPPRQDFAVFFAFLLVISIFSFVFFEKPANRFFKSWLVLPARSRDVPAP